MFWVAFPTLRIKIIWLHWSLNVSQIWANPPLLLRLKPTAPFLFLFHLSSLFVLVRCPIKPPPQSKPSHLATRHGRTGSTGGTDKGNAQQLAKERENNPNWPVQREEEGIPGRIHNPPGQPDTMGGHSKRRKRRRRSNPTIILFLNPLITSLSKQRYERGGRGLT